MERIFRPSVWPLLAQALIVYWALTLLRRGYFLLAQEKWIPIYNSTIIGGTVGLAIAMAAVAWWYKVKTSDESIKGPNIWGGFTTIPLASGLQFKETIILGFKYLKIWGVGEGAIWVPLPVSEQSDLYALLKKQNEENT